MRLLYENSAETINLVTSFVSPICKVTSKTAIQYNISPFIYLHVRFEGIISLVIEQVQNIPPLQNDINPV